MSYPCLDYYKDEAHVAPEVVNILKDFTLYNFYNKLHSKVTNAITTDSRCYLCSTSLTRRTQEGTKLLELCQKFCYILLNLEEIKTIYENIHSDDLCPFTSYWLYDRVTKIPDFLSFSSSFYHTLQTLSKHPLSELKKCSLKNYETEKSEFTNLKILYEFLHIYDDIKNKLNSTEDYSKIKLYCKHIKENFRFYNDVKVNCSNNICKYHTELQNFKNKFRSSDELEFICEKCDYTKTSCEQGFSGEGDVPCLREKGNSFLYQLFGNDADNIINILLKVTTISAPILALFVILFKFTPFGKNLNKLKQERKKSGHKKKEVNIQDYMKNYAAHLDSEMKNRVHLGYHPT
ncbi:PIR protein [Plasmodium vivax]|uniref:VIR protein n=1 Tax=Plasmodium vivax TaxID=5855 RepID=A0A564ZUY8_PLAVI|nr:PIR protein [Plasmodium vivax]